ncbi:hypothetical protein OG698_13270 [Streptomyces sp. NBC_01003]|uniref:hypothetical protein n=1 Tax=Streptomyces sp. NBC_01003 TaxID=2903714 RepID=UPI0038695A24|nr:hypothetical protein OG698_13270 [Streptomyces sp. NBC_01003]
MRTTKLLVTAGLLGASALTALLGAGTAFAGSGDSGDSGDDKAPTEAGTSFRTAQEVEQGRRATAGASTGDYLYWSFPADAGQRPTVKATVKLPDSAARPSGATWRIDVYDGLRRRQSCMYGTQSRAAAQDASSVDLSCTLRTVRAWSEQWANDPLPGTYYVRLTAATLTPSDQGLPVSAEVEVTSKKVGGSAAVDGSLAAPLVPGSTTEEAAAAADDASDEENGSSASQALATGEPEDGWSSGWWSDRWVWTAAGGILAALAGIGGYALTRGTGRPSRVPPGM